MLHLFKCSCRGWWVGSGLANCCIKLLILDVNMKIGQNSKRPHLLILFGEFLALLCLQVNSWKQSSQVGVLEWRKFHFHSNVVCHDPKCSHSFHCLSLKVCQSEQKRRHHDPAGTGDSSSRHSGTGQDSGFGSDSARIRIVQIEQQSGASHHCIARPSHKSSITKNLSFIPFDIFLTASRLSVMTYSCSSSPKAFHSSSDDPRTPEKETGEKVKPKKASSSSSEGHKSILCLRLGSDWLSAKHKQFFF